MAQRISQNLIARFNYADLTKWASLATKAGCSDVANILSLLVFIAGSAAVYYAHRAPILAAPTCDQRVMECGR